MRAVVASCYVCIAAHRRTLSIKQDHFHGIYLYWNREPLFSLPNERLGEAGLTPNCHAIAVRAPEIYEYRSTRLWFAKAHSGCLHSCSFSSSPLFVNTSTTTVPSSLRLLPTFSCTRKRQQIRTANPEGVGCFRGLCCSRRAT